MSPTVFVRESVVRPVLERGLNKIRLATFQKHGIEAQSAARGVMKSAARQLAERHYKLVDELPHVARFVGGSLRYPYRMRQSGTEIQFTPNYYCAAGVMDLIAQDVILKQAFGVDSRHAVERTASARHAVIRFVDEFHAKGGLSEKAVKDLEDELGKARVEKLQERIPEAQHKMDAVLKRFFAGATDNRDKVRRMRVVERLRNGMSYVTLPFMLLESERP
ncbi:hypothetical protein H0O03_03335 [Candidatus Micrarchaeota archaeon]|nr:hypothetical protein [Candidatus Micrarchaeota archaeon]